MQFKNFVLAPSALYMTKPSSIEDWTELSTFLCNLQRSTPWWLGDMQVRGEQAYGDDIYQAFDETLSINMLQRCYKVAREFPPGSRNTVLSNSHHAQLVGMPKEVQSALLARAELEGWDNEALRKAIRGLR
jgi:hypothetical protein